VEPILEPVAVILAISPLLIVLVCALILRLPGDLCGLAGLLAAAIVALTFFQTESAVVWKSVIAGILMSLPISLLVASCMFQAIFMEKAGAIKRITVLLKCLSPGDDAARVIIINIGLAAILSWFGINPLAILPLLLIGMGYSTYAAIALPAIGTATLFIFSTYGATLETFFFHLGGGQTFDQSTNFFVDYIWLPVFISCLGILYLSGKARSPGHALVTSALTALTAWVVLFGATFFGRSHYAGILIGIAVIVIFILFSVVMKRPVFDRNSLKIEKKETGRVLPLWTALLPVILTIIFLAPIHLITPLKLYLSDLWPAIVRTIPSEPFRINPLVQPFFWIFIATLICIPVIPRARKAFTEAAGLWTRRAPRPIIAAALFFAAAVVMMHSGKALLHTGAWYLPEGHLNMLLAVQAFCATTFREAYPYLGVVAGLRMGFLSGSQRLPIEMLTRIHLELTEYLLKPGGPGTFTAAGSALAASIGLMMNPARLMNASAIIGKTGYESRAMRSTFVIALLAVIGTGIIALIKASL
jgi:lactate permease